MKIEWKDWDKPTPATLTPEAEQNGWVERTVSELKRRWKSEGRSYIATTRTSGDSMVVAELIPNTYGPPTVYISDTKIRRVAQFQLEVKP